MDPALLAPVFLVAMGAAVLCFVVAFARRRDRPRHVRWAVTGTLLDLAGTAAVLVTTRWLRWHVPPRAPEVAAVHRAFAYVATGLLLLVAVTGATRHPLHRRLGPVFLPVYVATYALAVWAYAPWG